MAARSEWLSHESDLAAVALLLLLLLLLVCCSNGTEPIFRASRARASLRGGARPSECV